MITIAAATCLAMNVYWEARNQSVDGQRLVAEVTLERTMTPGFPSDICGVVWEHRAFSWTQDGKSDEPTDPEAWLLAQIIANETLLYGCDLCTGATHLRDDRRRSLLGAAAPDHWDVWEPYLLRRP